MDKLQFQMQQLLTAYQQISKSQSPSLTIPVLENQEKVSRAPHPDYVRRDAQRAIQPSFNTEDSKFKGHEHEDWESHVLQFDRILKCYNVYPEDKRYLF